MYKDFYIEFWLDGAWQNTVMILPGKQVEALIKSRRERGESIRVRRMDIETEQLETTYSFISNADKESYAEYMKKQRDKQIALLKKKEPLELLTEEQAQVMLERLTNHFGCPVRPVNQYCEALHTWVHRITEINRGEGENSLRQGSSYYEHLRKIMIDIHKSNLLRRLIYAGEKLREEPCPIHSKSGCSFDGCFYGCGECGWLPN